MKFNFWRWLGVVLLIIGCVLIYERNRNSRSTEPAHPTTAAPTTQMVPATQGTGAQ
jgi:hypothetical protein